jgi:hypothetical protein
MDLPETTTGEFATRIVGLSFDFYLGELRMHYPCTHIVGVASDSENHPRIIDKLAILGHLPSNLTLGTDRARLAFVTAGDSTSSV